MSYRIEDQGRLPEEILRNAREQLQKAISEIDKTEDLRERVHAVRTCLKKTRSLLRFIRPCVRRGFFDTENRRLRNIGRRLAPMRDAFVQLSSFNEFKMPAKNPTVTCAREMLERRDAQEFAKAPAELKEIRPQLVEALHAVDGWPIEDFRRQDFCSGMCLVYRTARKALAKAGKKPTPENLHAWRGKTKILWYALRLIADFSSKPLKKQSKCAKELGEVLGDYHDLVVLMGTLDQLPDSVSGRKSVYNSLSKEGTRLKKRGFKLGEKIFKTKPAAWKKEMSRCIS